MFQNVYSLLQSFLQYQYVHPYQENVAGWEVLEDYLQIYKRRHIQQEMNSKKTIFVWQVAHQAWMAISHCQVSV